MQSLTIDTLIEDTSTHQQVMLYKSLRMSLDAFYTGYNESELDDQLTGHPESSSSGEARDSIFNMIEQGALLLITAHGIEVNPDTKVAVIEALVTTLLALSNDLTSHTEDLLVILSGEDAEVALARLVEMFSALSASDVIGDIYEVDTSFIEALQVHLRETPTETLTQPYSTSHQYPIERITAFNNLFPDTIGWKHVGELQLTVPTVYASLVAIYQAELLTMPTKAVAVNLVSLYVLYESHKPTQETLTITKPFTTEPDPALLDEIDTILENFYG